MTIGRSIATRMEEAVYLVVSQDPDLFAHWGGVVGSGSYAVPDTPPRCFIGPMIVDPQDVSAPQGHVACILPPPLEDGVGGTTLATYTVRVTLIEDMDEPTRTTGGTRPFDYVAHVIKVVKAVDSLTERLTDPDNTSQKINDGLDSVTVTQESDYAARFIAFGIDFELNTFQDIEGAIA